MTTYFYKRQSELPESIDDFCGELVSKVIQQEKEFNLTPKDRIIYACFVVTPIALVHGIVTNVNRTPERTFDYIIAGELIYVAAVMLTRLITGKYTEIRTKMNFSSIKYGPYFNRK